MQTNHANIARNFERNALAEISPQLGSGPAPTRNGPKARRARAIRYSANASKSWVKALVQLLKFAGSK